MVSIPDNRGSPSPIDAARERHQHPCQHAYARLRTRILMSLTQPSRRWRRGIQSIIRTVFLILDVPTRWLMDIGDTVIGNRGHVAIGSALAAYFVVFGIIDAKSTQEETRAAVARSHFIMLVSAANAASFIAAVKDFGPTQTMPATEHPSRFRFWEWGSLYQPNKGPMHEWAEWRLHLCDATRKDCSTDGKVRIDLSFAHMNNADLSNTDLSGSDLRYASLCGADLTNVNLGGADLSSAELTGAILGPDNLNSAILDKAGLTRADLGGADLRHASLRGAHLDSADLSGADLRYASLRGADLSGAHLDGQTQLDEACGAPARLPEGLHPQEPCPSP